MNAINEQMSATVQALIERVQAKQKEIAELKRVINGICREAGMDPAFEETEEDAAVGGAHVRVRPDEFYGKSVLTAARMYLDKRKQAVGANEILKALQDGGFDFGPLDWDDSNLLRPLAMSMSKNTAIFHRLPNGTFGLAAWYPGAVNKKKAKRAGAAENGEEEETAAE